MNDTVKKVIFGFVVGVLIILFGHMAFANNLYSVSASPVSSDFLIKSTTLGTVNTVGTITLTGGVTCTLNLRARGADIRWCKTNSTTEAYWTIGDCETWSDHFPVPLDNGTVLYFWSATAPVTIEAWYTYR